jgi:subtilisin family serine protease
VRKQPALAIVKYTEFLSQISTDKAARIIVAVLDTGYKPSTAPVGNSATILPAVSLVAGETAEDGNGHGTLNINLLAALVPLKEVQILPIKVLDNVGRGTTSTIVQGFATARERSARIIYVPVGEPRAALRSGRQIGG